MESKTLILVRHAHRDTSLRSLDNGLSSRGKIQADKIAETLMKEWGVNKNTLLISSAKVRCMETLEPLSDALGVELKTNDLLMEQLPDESEEELNERIDQFIAQWKTEMPSLVVACSHGDWLPVAIDRMTGKFVDMSKGSFIKIQSEKGEVKLSGSLWMPA